MAASIVEKATAVVEKITGSSSNGESKSARKKKEKAEAAKAAAATNSTATATPQEPSNETSVVPDADGSTEHAYVKELQKQIRNINKKLSGMQKTDAVIAENPGVSLDDLVAQRKLNNDQRSAALKKPGLQAQLADLEERIQHYRSFDADYQTKFTKQRDDLTAAHTKEVASLREELRVEAASATAGELRKKLLIFSQFLRAAAAKRTVEEEADSEESKAFEGALLLVYGGDSKAVDTALSIIEGSSEKVPSIDGEPLQVDYAQIKKSSTAHAPFQTEEDWVDRVAEANEAGGSDPTVLNAGLTELEAPNQINGSLEAQPEPSAPRQGSVAEASGNLAGDSWDIGAAGSGAEKGGMEDSYVHVPRPNEEVDIPAEVSTQQPSSTSNWADDVATHEATGNTAGEAWDTKAPGEQQEDGWASAEPAVANGTADDGFHEVSGRSRGRGGPRGGRGGDGEFRGRGGRRGNFRGRGDGEFRGRGGYRGARGEGESRGAGRGRGRGGPRAGAEGAATTNRS